MPKKKKVRSVADLMTEKKKAPSSADPKADLMKIAQDVRTKANSLSDEKREASFSHGMRLIYGGTNRVAAKTGRA